MLETFHAGSTVLFALFVCAAPVSADVLVVDAAGGGDYVEISDAVAAAADGDTVLVRSGTYEGFTIFDKDLRVVADVGAAVACTSAIGVNGAGGSKAVWLAGLSATGTQSAAIAPGSGLFVLSHDGPVRVQDCVFEGARGLPEHDEFGTGVHLAGWDAVRTFGASDVVFTRCELIGGEGALTYEPPDCCSPVDVGGAGLWAIGGGVALYDCVVRGGEGGTGDVEGGDGGTGLMLANGAVAHVAGSTLVGGDGGDGLDEVFATPGDGGDGLRVTSGASAQLLDVSLQGGTGGLGFVTGQIGTAGSPSSGTPPTIYPGVARNLAVVPSPVREGGLVSVQYEGEEGDLAVLGVSVSGTSAPLPVFSGVLHTGGPLLYVLGVAPLGGGGALQTSFPFGNLQAGVESVDLYVQVLGVNPSAQIVLGSTVSLNVIDSQF